MEGSVILPIYKKGDETDCGDYWGKSLLSTIYKFLSNIHLSGILWYSISTVYILNKS